MAAKVALVTGANQGIGYGLVQRICKEHPQWIVYGTSRSAANGEQAQKKLQDVGLTARFVEADITKPETIKALKEKLVKEHGGLDVLVNNAGFCYPRGATEHCSTKVQVVMNTNVFGTYMVCEQLFPILKDGARVTIVSSGLAHVQLRNIHALNMDRYKSYIEENPPMNLDTVIQSMKDFVESVKCGNFAAKGWARDEADFAGNDWSDETAYSTSKLGNTLMVRAYQHHFTTTAPERDIVVNAVDPGYVRTNMTGSQGPLSVDEGADNVYYTVVLPPHTPIRGKHISNKKIVPWK